MGRALAFGLYEGAMARLVVALKFHGFDLLAGPAGARMAALAGRGGLLDGETPPEAVVPVPSTPRRNRERGYDPARLLAEEVARRLRLPLRRDVARVRDTPPQSSLPAGRRAANVAGAFRGAARARGRRLLLVDDVVTTGATAFAAATALRVAGAARVDLLVLARTPAPEDHPHPETAP